MISEATARRIALAYREIGVAEKLLEDVNKAVSSFDQKDIRDAFGRRQSEMSLGVPSGDDSRRLFGVPYSLAVPVIEAHIAQQRAILSALNESALIEARGEQVPA